MKAEELFENSPFLNAYQERQTYYHGTVASIDFSDGKLLPPKETATISEVGRKKNLDKVFFTEDIGSARVYAGRASRSIGGDPVVYEVSPVGKIDTLNDKKGSTVHYADWAYVVRRVA